MRLSFLSRSWETQPVWQNLSSFSAAYTQCMTVVVRQHVYFGSSKNYSDKRHTNLCLGIASTRILIFHFFQLYFLKTGCHFFSFFFFLYAVRKLFFSSCIIESCFRMLETCSLLGGLMRCDLVFQSKF